MTCFVSERNPAYVFTVAVILGLGKHDVVINAVAVLFDELTSLTVVVVVHRTAAVVRSKFVLLGHFEVITEAGENQRRIVRRNRRLEFYRTVRIDGVNLVSSELKVVFTE